MSLIDQIVREGAQRMLAAAVRAEADAYCAQHTGELGEDGHRLVERHGYAEPRTVMTSAGAVEVTAPRVNDKRIDERCRFSSAILPPWCRLSPRIAEVLPLLYLHGLAGGDFVSALGAAPRLGGGPVGLDSGPAGAASSHLWVPTVGHWPAEE